MVASQIPIEAVHDNQAEVNCSHYCVVAILLIYLVGFIVRLTD